MHQPTPRNPYQEPSVTVKGETLQVVDNFTYLGSTLSKAVNITVDVNSRMAKAVQSSGKIAKTSGSARESALQKLKVYRGTVFPTLLYACVHT